MLYSFPWNIGILLLLNKAQIVQYLKISFSLNTHFFVVHLINQAIGS